MSVATDRQSSILGFLVELIWLPLLVRVDGMIKKHIADFFQAGGIIQATSYKVAFYAMGGAFGAAFILIFFWMPETAYVRTGTINLDTNSNDVSLKNAQLKLE